VFEAAPGALIAGPSQVIFAVFCPEVGAGFSLTQGVVGIVDVCEVAVFRAERALIALKEDAGHSCDGKASCVRWRRGIKERPAYYGAWPLFSTWRADAWRDEQRQMPWLRASDYDEYSRTASQTRLFVTRDDSPSELR
jgi:hypothetical protein